ncbi:hypothetical protein PG988_004341 [Apiospora saccharicola]
MADNEPIRRIANMAAIPANSGERAMLDSYILSCVKAFDNDYAAVRARERTHIMKGVFRAGWNSDRKPIVPEDFTPKDLGITQVGIWKHDPPAGAQAQANANRLIDRPRQARTLAKSQETVKP